MAISENGKTPLHHGDMERLSRAFALLVSSQCIFGIVNFSQLLAKHSTCTTRVGIQRNAPISPTRRSSAWIAFFSSRKSAVGFFQGDPEAPFASRTLLRCFPLGHPRYLFLPAADEKKPGCRDTEQSDAGCGADAASPAIQKQARRTNSPSTLQQQNWLAGSRDPIMVM